MKAHVSYVAHVDAGEIPHGFNVIAARDIKAGQLDCPRGLELKPPKPERKPEASEHGGD